MTIEQYRLRGSLRVATPGGAVQFAAGTIVTVRGERGNAVFIRQDSPSSAAWLPRKKLEAWGARIHAHEE